MSLTKVDLKPTSFEFACVCDSGNQFRLYVVYRPPPSPRNGLKTSDFLSQFDDFLDEVTLFSGKLLFLGGFNLHLDNPSKPEVAHFLTSIADAGLSQHITEPTHKFGHTCTLDLIISRPDDLLVIACTVLDILYSDHHVIKCVINRAKPHHPKITTNSRNYRDLDNDAFRSDMIHALESFPFDGSIEGQVSCYEKTISTLLDLHCSVTTHTRRLKSFKDH